MESVICLHVFSLCICTLCVFNKGPSVRKMDSHYTPPQTIALEQLPFMTKIIQMTPCVQAPLYMCS